MTIGKFDYYLLYSNGYSRRVLEIGYDVVSVGMLVRFRETIGLFSAAEIGKSAADLYWPIIITIWPVLRQTRAAPILMAWQRAKRNLAGFGTSQTNPP